MPCSKETLCENEPSQIDPTLLDLWEEQMVEEGQSIFEKETLLSTVHSYF
jgi:hypothetical protein